MEGMYRTLTIRLIEANDLKDVNFIFAMRVFALIAIEGDQMCAGRKQTPKQDGGTNPTFNYSVEFSVIESYLRENQLSLKVDLMSDRLLGNKHIGAVRVPLKDLFDQTDLSQEKKEAGGQHDGVSGSEKIVQYSVERKHGHRKGTLRFGFKFGENLMQHRPPPPPQPAYPAGYKFVNADSTFAYPPPQASVYAPQYAHPQPPPVCYPPPPPPQLAMGHVHPAGYPYPPVAYPPPSLGYPPPVAYPSAMSHHPYAAAAYPPAHKSKKKMLGLGVGAGLLGGLLVGDLLSDAGEMAYESGYDDGFSNGLDF